MFRLSPFSALRENVFLFALPFRILASIPMRWTSPLARVQNPLSLFAYRHRAELLHWADPSVVAKIGKWRNERHLQFVVYSDASSFAWGGLFPQKSLVSISDYWFPSSADFDITTKETKAFINTLLSFVDDLRNARVDAYVDNQSLAQAWQPQVLILPTNLLVAFPPRTVSWLFICGSAFNHTLLLAAHMVIPSTLWLWTQTLKAISM